MKVHPQIEKDNNPDQSMSMPATACIHDCSSYEFAGLKLNIKIWSVCVAHLD